MDMNFGSGSALLGGGDQALQEAISRRQTGQGGATGSVSPASPTYSPQIQQPNVNPVSAPSGGQTPVSPPVQPSVGAGMGLPANTPESELIVKALDQRLRSLSKLQGA